MEQIPTESHIVFAGSAGPAEARWHWRHLKRCAATEHALEVDAEIPDDLAEALMERDTLPRVSTIDGHTLVILRGINHAPNAEPEDMISLRLAFTGNSVLSVEIRRLRQIDSVIGAFRSGHPPASPSDFLHHLVEAMRIDAEAVLDELEADLGRLERLTAVHTRGLSTNERKALIDLRQDAIQLHRYINPQGQALDSLARQKPAWLGARRALREEALAFRRIAADLESVRMRAQLVAEEASLAVSERTNRIMLTLSAVSVVFLPITALTGLLGVNLAGIPFAEAPWAFAAFAISLLIVAGLAAWLAMRLLR